MPYVKPVNHLFETGNLLNSPEDLPQESTPLEDQMCLENPESTQMHETSVRKISQKVLEFPKKDGTNVRKRNMKTDSGKEMNEADIVFCKYIQNISSNGED